MAESTDIGTALRSLPTPQTTHCAELSARDLRRRKWLRETINAWSAASGVPVDERDPDQIRRFAYFASELELSGYTKAQADAARWYITRGWPCRRGTLLLADFYPTAKELDECGYVPQLAVGAISPEQALREREIRNQAFESGRASEFTLFQEWRADVERRYGADRTGWRE